MQKLEVAYMTIKDYTEYKEAEILRLYAEVGWTAYTDAPDTLRKGFETRC